MRGRKGEEQAQGTSECKTGRVVCRRRARQRAGGGTLQAADVRAG